MTIRFVAAALFTLLPAPALAAERTVTVTRYDRIRVDGPYRVEVITGRGPSAKISGDRATIDRVDVQVQGMTLIVRANRTAWQGGWPGEASGGPVTVRLTTGELRSASILGSGSMTIDAVRGPRISLAVEGSGRMNIGMVETDRIDLGLTGSGALTLAGNAKALTATVRGIGAIDGAGMIANDLQLNSESAGNIVLAARTSAKILATGSGEVTILGKPACTVTALGSGPVVCGAGR